MKVKNQKNVSRIVKASGMALLLFSAVGQPGMTAYAAGPGETVQAQVEQSPRWEGQGDAWRVKTEDGKGYLTNAWFQDLDGSWYMLGADGYMYSGIVTDPSTGASYLLNTEHDGHFGRMVTANGAYIINGQQVYLTFNNTNPADGTYGAITGGLTELRAAGVKEVTKGAEGTAPQAAQQTPAQEQDYISNTGNAEWDAWVNSLSAEDRAIVAEELADASPEYVKAVPNMDPRIRDRWLRDEKDAREKLYVDEEAARALQSVMHGF